MGDSDSHGESMGWSCFEWDSRVNSDFPRDVWNVEEDKAVWLQCPSLMVLTRLALFTGGAGLVPCKSTGGR